MNIYAKEKLTAKIISELYFCSNRTAYRVYDEVRNRLNKPKPQLITVAEFVELYGIKKSRIIYDL